ncbi:MAG: glycosyltransferase family 39 protein [Deltaproteobacteria bacterium]|nr:glycosyltransferase family 39 protein [Deltaproteobacteria bacterium]
MKGAERRDAALVIGTALGARVAMVAWAASRIPPTGDGKFYDVIATRIAQGHGYTWLWPDGVVTYAAHYPVGYPALLGAAYAVFGAKPAAAMMVNALLGTAAAAAAWALARRATSRAGALAAGLLVALHVGLVAYTPALMTEGATAALCVIAAWQACRAREAKARRRTAWLAAAGLTLGLCTLVRPQSLVLAPLLGWFALEAEASWSRRLRTAAFVGAIALAACAPWALRNEVRLGHAALSFNGGWNLLIGTNPAGHGSWSPVEVPQACKEVFHEAEKDICFGREAVKAIAAHPLTWLSLVPAKLSVTFDYCGGAGWYLREANGAAFDDAWKLRLGVVETLYERMILIAALVAGSLGPGPRRRPRMVVAALSIAAALTHWGWLAYVGLGLVLALLGRALHRAPLLIPSTLAMILSTAAIHAVFFGSGRYSMVVFPFVTALACGLLTRGRQQGHTLDPEGDLVDAPH